MILPHLPSFKHGVCHGVGVKSAVTGKMLSSDHMTVGERVDRNNLRKRLTRKPVAKGHAFVVISSKVTVTARTWEGGAAAIDLAHDAHPLR